MSYSAFKYETVVSGTYNFKRFHMQIQCSYEMYPRSREIQLSTYKKGTSSLTLHIKILFNIFTVECTFAMFKLPGQLFSANHRNTLTGY